jgi:hypothetical protein
MREGGGYRLNREEKRRGEKEGNRRGGRGKEE